MNETYFCLILLKTDKSANWTRACLTVNGSSIIIAEDWCWNTKNGTALFDSKKSTCLTINGRQDLFQWNKTSVHRKHQIHLASKVQDSFHYWHFMFLPFRGVSKFRETWVTLRYFSHFSTRQCPLSCPSQQGALNTNLNCSWQKTFKMFHDIQYPYCFQSYFSDISVFIHVLN